MRFWPILVIVCITLVAPILITGGADPGVEDVGDSTLFTNSGKRTTYVLVGESEVDLDVFLSQNASDWELAVSSPLFEEGIGGVNSEMLPAGTQQNHKLPIDRGAPLGTYSIAVYLNYTDDEGERVERVWNHDLQYLAALEIRNFRLETGLNNRIIMEIETFQRCDEMQVILHGEGHLEPERRSHDLEDMPPGNYTIQSRVDYQRAQLSDDDEIGYEVRAVFSGHYVEFTMMNVDPSDVMVSEPDSFILVGLIVVSTVIVISLVIAILYHRRKDLERLE